MELTSLDGVVQAPGGPDEDSRVDGYRVLRFGDFLLLDHRVSATNRVTRTSDPGLRRR